MSAELRSCTSENPDAPGDAESWSLAKSLAESGGVVASLASLFMARSTEAASSSCTCWCFEMSSFEVTDHSGVCSHLERKKRSVHDFSQTQNRSLYSQVRPLGKPVHRWHGAGRNRGIGRETGHQQMLGQAAAMLVTLSALLATELRPVALPAFLDQRLTVTRPPNACFLESPVGLVRGSVILVVVNGAVLGVADRAAGAHDKLVGGQARGRGRQATQQARACIAIFRHRVAAGPDRDGERHRHIPGFG